MLGLFDGFKYEDLKETLNVIEDEKEKGNYYELFKEIMTSENYDLYFEDRERTNEKSKKLRIKYGLY